MRYEDAKKGRYSIHARALDHVVLEVRDVTQSLKFYHELLGLPTVREEAFFRHDVPFASVKVGDALIDLFPMEVPGPGPNHLCIEMDDAMDDIIGALDTWGITHTPPATRFGARGDGLSVYIHDPDGHPLEIRTYASTEK